ncbi:MAG: hypothetical protein R3222_09955 [Balneolaceae bacterium]|nr:hypothetical protein [Balneolaceae bacterium]
MVLVVACQPQDGQQDQASNGMVLTGDRMGSEFVIATGDHDEIVMDMVGAYNRMNADSVWHHAADTISFHSVDGYEGPMTKSDMQQFFTSVDSVVWKVYAVIPVKLVDGDRVNVLADGSETVYRKDGTVQRMKLFERFIFEGNTLVGVRQWKAEMPPSDSDE